MRVAGDDWRPELPLAVARGAYHVHTRRSDGTGTAEEIAAAAGRAGLDFVVLTDHGDATRTPDAPRYVGAVLVIDAVEISTRGGHYAALGLTGAAPYRLAGSPRDVIDDVARMGGAGFVTHPDSAKKSLAWRDWSLPVAGFEWLNADSEWRDEGRLALGRTLLSYPFRPVPAVTSLLDRPVATLERWDAMMKEGRYLVALAGADAHARLGVRDYEEEGGGDAMAVPLPGYETVFRAFSTRVLLDEPLSGAPDADARRVIAAMAQGRSYTVVDGHAAPARFEFFARGPGGPRTMGESLLPDEPVSFVVRALAPAGSRLRLLRNGVQVAESSGLELVHETTTSLAGGERGAGFRAEVVVPGAPGDPPVPWIVSNPLFVGRAVPPGDRPSIVPPAGAEDGGPNERRPPGHAASIGVDLRACRSEKNSTSTSEIEVNEGGDRLRWRWRLSGGGEPAWVALACAIPPVGPGDTILFRATADTPLRLSVQLREAATAASVVHRWQRTVYVDQSGRSFRVPVSGLEPVEKGGSAQVPAGTRTLLLVVDWVHGLAGMRRDVLLETAAVQPGS
jgi:hypothetical protein